MKPPYKWLGVLVLLSLASVGGLIRTHCATRATEAHFAMVREGMTRQEVEALLGKSSNLELYYPYGLNDHRRGRVGIAYDRDQGFWRMSLDEFVIDFDYQHGTVCRKYVFAGGPDKRGLWERINDQFRDVAYQLGWRRISVQ